MPQEYMQKCRHKFSDIMELGLDRKVRFEVRVSRISASKTDQIDL